MLLQTIRITKLQERAINTPPYTTGASSSAFIDDEGQLYFRVSIEQEDGGLLTETITFNRYEVQQIRAVLGKA